MTLAFTICSTNYLAQAHALGKSLEKYAPNCKFIIGLVDKLDRDGVEVASFPPFDIIEVQHVSIPNFDWMCINYDIVELNTAVKPYYIKHLFETFPEVDKLIYFDPDITIFQPLTHLEKTLSTVNIILTPHFLEPIRDDKRIAEQDALNYGIYNLGFIAMRRSTETLRFTDWWCERLATLCKHDLCNGLFVDQLWCNLVPCFFEGVHIEKSRGYNMAYWNLQERKLSKKGEEYFVNEQEPLYFYHFSNFDARIENNIAQKQNRFDLISRPDLLEIYHWYDTQLNQYHDKHLKQFPCEYGLQAPKPKKYQTLRQYLSFPFRRITRLIENF